MRMRHAPASGAWTQRSVTPLSESRRLECDVLASLQHASSNFVSTAFWEAATRCALLAYAWHEPPQSCKAQCSLIGEPPQKLGAGISQKGVPCYVNSRCC